ncbi:hypothetical protein BTO23_15085 [Aliivibrio sifiae]|uniref:Uncharacterized protein n=2 Tax=Aliivibrio sifiae TaxID=566293 RepID=A0A2S7X8H6_9GAMM|nr:hypothetical protein BTO23_15085 [Aliivibrio sifiae]GLR77306.1 hypothetical protein GCM10007855_41810 [Aliivibrio sifiae]
MPMRKMQACSFSLVSHPITNNEFSNKQQRNNLKSSLENSKLYAIAQARYPRIDFKMQENGIEITISNDEFKSVGYIDIFYLFKVNYPEYIDAILSRDVLLNFKTYSDPNCYFVIGIKEKDTGNMIREGMIEISAWQLLFYKSRGERYISGFDNYKDFLKLFIHYVGKTSKSTYERLSKGHHARLNILSSEEPINRQNLLSEELLILAFEVDAVNIIQNPKEYDLGETKLNDVIDLVERSLISSLMPKYNEVKYKSHGEKFKESDEFDSCCLTLNDNIQLFTDEAKLCGKYDASGLSNSDYIILDESGISLNNI